jgi:chorismate synthase
MANIFGRIFRIMTFGESHGPGVGVVIEGLPGNLRIDLPSIQSWLDRRRPGQSHLTSPRDESDEVACLGGLENGRTLGGPVALYVKNKDIKRSDYKDINNIYRPGHADFTMNAKYGITATSGGGRSSARETVGRVAAGAVAWQLLKKIYPSFEVLAWVQQIKDIAVEPNTARGTTDHLITKEMIERTPVRCPDVDRANQMIQLIENTRTDGDSLGGVIRCVVKGLPSGLGEPVFDKMDADLAKAMLSLPACKGIEIGSGFAGTEMLGSVHNDQLVKKDSKISALTNHSGGIQGGITNGESIVFNVAFKPVSTIARGQRTVDRSGKEITFKPEGGRHDPCVLPRAVPMIEAMACLVLADHALRYRATAPFIES